MEKELNQTQLSLEKKIDLILEGAVTVTKEIYGYLTVKEYHSGTPIEINDTLLFAFTKDKSHTKDKRNGKLFKLANRGTEFEIVDIVMIKDKNKEVPIPVVEFLNEEKE